MNSAVSMIVQRAFRRLAHHLNYLLLLQETGASLAVYRQWEASIIRIMNIYIYIYIYIYICVCVCVCVF